MAAPPAQVHLAAPARPEFSRRSILVQLASQIRRETASVLLHPGFLGILAFGLGVLLQAADSAGNLFDMPVHPRTHLMLEALQGCIRSSC